MVTSALIAASATACTRSQDETRPAIASDPTASGAASTRGPGGGVAGKTFSVTTATDACHANGECTGTLRLAVTGGYHVNKEYPYKVTFAPVPGVGFLGRAEPNVFSKAAGDFVEDDETHATMSFRFRPAAAGPVKLAGVYKLSVCSAASCLMEAQPVEIPVDVR
jgi:hypothetical protein